MNHLLRCLRRSRMASLTRMNMTREKRLKIGLNFLVSRIETASAMTNRISRL